MRARLVLALVTLVVAVSGCGGDDDDRLYGVARPDVGRAGPDAVHLSFIQLRVDEGTSRAQLRVINDTDDELTVTGVGLDWPGYGDFVTDYDTVVAPRRVLDLRFELPAPDCAAGADDLALPVMGRLRLAGADDLGGEVDDELDESGTGYVTRIRQRTCDEQRVEDAVELRYGPGWRIEGTGRRSALVGPLTLVRGDDDGPIALVDVLGTVLLRPLLTSPLVLPAGQEQVSREVRIVIPRCDEHALTESSQTFHFHATFRFGEGSDAETISVLRLPDAATQEAGQQFLQQACVVNGSAE